MKWVLPHRLTSAWHLLKRPSPLCSHLESCCQPLARLSSQSRRTGRWGYVDCWTLESEAGTECVRMHWALRQINKLVFSAAFMVESHGPVYEHLARAHHGDEEGRALVSPISADHLLPGRPGLPGTALRGELIPTPHTLKLSSPYLCKSTVRISCAAFVRAKVFGPCCLISSFIFRLT